MEGIKSIEYDNIYHGDCLDIMKGMDDDSVNLIIADPPYGIDYQSNYKKEKFDKLENDNTFLLDWIDEAYRVLKPGGAIYCYTRWDVYNVWFDKLQEKHKIKNTIIWYKRGGGLGDLKGAYMFNHEFIIYAVKGRHILNGKRESDVWEVSKGNTSKYLHPTQKPTELAERIILKSSVENDVVLIPFLGSGNDVIACIENNRRYIGIEKEDHYFEKVDTRIKNYTRVS